MTRAWTEPRRPEYSNCGTPSGVRTLLEELR